jgi:ubiquitin-conjugating enzyme E2 J1
MTSRSPAVKRLMKELMDLRNDPCPEFTASPLDDNVFEWVWVKNQHIE